MDTRKQTSPFDHSGAWLPESLERQLSGFRNYVWLTKLLQSFSLALLSCLLAFVTILVSDRLLDTWPAVRWALMLSSVIVWTLMPWTIYRWMWSYRRPEQLARLLREREPAFGDELLSAIELAANSQEQSRSPELCQAAIGQAAASAVKTDLRKWSPPNRLPMLVSFLVLNLCIVCASAWWIPTATGNAWQRLTRPWRAIERYTFVAVQALPERLVVAHGEPTQWSVQLKPDSAWSPATAYASLGNSPELPAQLNDNRYPFQLPPLTAQTELQLIVGDFDHQVQLEPKLRPELTTVTAEVSLPEYLQRDAPLDVDVRSGVLSVVEGSQARLIATATRPLQHANFDDIDSYVDGSQIRTQTWLIDGNEKASSLRWRDQDGLDGSSAFQLQVKPMIDEPPSVTAQDLPRQCVLLDSEQLNFRVLAADDFGIRRVGMRWRGVDENPLVTAAQGQAVLSAGGADQSSLQVSGAFCAANLGIAAQTIQLTIWVEDYLPGRQPVESLPYLLYVLSPDQHALWITAQMNKWQRAALDVRDIEMQLNQSNQALRDRATQELTTETFRDELMRQAAAEQANARKLTGLAQQGVELLRQAARNSDISATSLDQWAKMLEALDDISRKRMPDVSDLLQQAAKVIDLDGSKQASAGASDSNSTASPGDMASTSSQPGEDSATQQLPIKPSAESTEGQSKASQLPSLTRVESSLQPADSPVSPEEGSDEKTDSKDQSTSEAQSGRLTMPQTALLGPTGQASQSEKKSANKTEATDKLDSALEKQQELLAEFEKLSDELNAVLSNLEGSTLVKRLKAASREQNLVAEKIATRIGKVFGQAAQVASEDRTFLNELSETERASGLLISYIMDDIQAFYQRRRTNEFKRVLDEMKSSDIVVAIQNLAEELAAEHGLSIATAEYWADNLDRWAEDLVESTDQSEKEKQEQKPGEESQSLPPSLILEMLKILESEVNLREQTRIAQQAVTAIEATDHIQQAQGLSGQQADLRVRTEEVSDQIAKLPDADQHFAQELSILSQVSLIMDQARELLALGNTGPEAIAAETEVIELMLQSKRINPQGAGSGGGGASPGGGGLGTTSESALALIGAGLNSQEHREPRDIGQAVGSSADRNLPEEFRGGLDAYFQQLETAP